MHLPETRDTPSRIEMLPGLESPHGPNVKRCLRMHSGYARRGRGTHDRITRPLLKDALGLAVPSPWIRFHACRPGALLTWRTGLQTTSVRWLCGAAYAQALVCWGV